MTTPDDLVESPSVELLRGALSRRATSAEFNEWQAREVVDYITALSRELDAQQQLEVIARESMVASEAKVAELRKAMVDLLEKFERTATNAGWTDFGIETATRPYRKALTGATE